MILARCKACGAGLRDVWSRNVFTKHAACPRCRIVYIVWGDTVTRCPQPDRCVGPGLVFLEACPPRRPIPKPKPGQSATP
jgi:hypothetical protein